MAEAAKVRLVRCPKCENLLPELPDFSLYQCGGCGAVLEAKQKGVVEDGLTDISDDDPGQEISEEGNIVEASEVKMGKPDNFEARILEEETRKEGVTCNGSSTSRAESIEAQSDSSLIRRGKQRIRNFESLNNNYTPYSQGLVHHPNLPINRGSNVCGLGYDHFRDEHVRDHRPPIEPLRPRPALNQWGVRNVGLGHGPERGDSAQMRFRYFDEGQSSYEADSYYVRGERTCSYPGPGSNEPARMGDSENGRAELIRRLDELKNQISRTCDISDKNKEMNGIDQTDPYGRRQSAYNYPEDLNKQPLKPDDMGPPYFPNPTGYIPYKANLYGSQYPERRYPQELMQCPVTYKPEILHRPPYGPHSQYVQHHPYHGPGYYGDVNNHDLFMLNHHKNCLHQPACSCMHCYDETWPGQHKADHPGPHNPRLNNGPSNNPNHRPLFKNGTRGSNLRTLGPQKSLPVNLNDVDSENDGLNYRRPRKIMVTHKNGRASRAVAGGAPFIGCSNCFEVLKIPRKCVTLGENQQRLKCGACSSVIVFELGDKGFIASSSLLVDQIPTETDEGSSGTLDENTRYSNGWSNSANLNTYSNEYENFQDQFSPDDKKSNSLVPNMQLDQLSSASSLSEDGEIPENQEQALTEVKSSPGQDLHHDQNIGINRFDQRNKSQRPATSQQKSAKDANMATEMDVSLNEFSNSCVSQDSVEISKETKATANKGSDSFFTGLIKTFKDFKRPNQGVETGDPQVSVNGHLIPNRVVKRAEKLAGPIQPGEYWYDKRAGFWGVMGHPCLGIIMPNIEEFNYPMAGNCAAGNTGVFVNGRELHQKDLDLLIARGLPVIRNKSYLVEITGRIIDEQTGEELDGLGKLAPTVERAKHGFGMKVPRFIAQSKN